MSFQDKNTSGDPCMNQVAAFEIFKRQYLDAEGEPLCELPALAQDRAGMVMLYEHMLLTRTFDEKAIALQRTGRLGTYASSLGQEAIGVGFASAMRKDDVLLPSFREHGAQLVRGVTVKELFLYWGGFEIGNNFGAARHDFPVSIPVASHFPHAAGAGLALKSKGTDAVAVALAGDGATSKGDFYEAINMAGVWKLPVVVVIANNGWAISAPRQAQTRAATLAQKGLAAGVTVEQVDGNDIVAVRAAADEALQRIRAGSGPCLIEALTYRLSDHTTADDARRYRDDDEVSAQWKYEPIARTRAFLTRHHDWGKEEEQALIEDCHSRVEAEAEAYLKTSAEPAAAMLDYLFETLPEPLMEARTRLAARREERRA